MLPIILQDFWQGQPLKPFAIANEFAIAGLMAAFDPRLWA